MPIYLILWEYFINFLELLFFYIFINTRLRLSDKCKHIRLKQFAFLLLHFFILSLMNRMDVSSMITTIFSCASDIIFALIFYKDALSVRLFWGSIYSVICMIADYIVVSVPQIVLNEGFAEMMPGGSLRISNTVSYIALIAVMVFLVHNIFNKDIRLSVVQKISYFVLSFVGILIGQYIVIISLESEVLFHNHEFTSKLITVNLFFIILFLFLLLYIYRLGCSNAENASLLEKEKLHELEALEYKNLKQSAKVLREIKHDMDIHLNIIQNLAENESLGELKAYINDYRKAADDAHDLLSTGNTAIDCIVSNKISFARKLNIKTDLSVTVPSDFPLDKIPLSSLLGNMWNNAIEACERLQKSASDIAPYIHFYIKPFQDMIIIHMENSYDRIIRQNDTYVSMKEDAAHGIGLKRMADIVSEANGIFKIKAENNVFTAHIMIPQKEPENEAEACNS